MKYLKKFKIFEEYKNVLVEEDKWEDLVGAKHTVKKI